MYPVNIADSRYVLCKSRTKAPTPGNCPHPPPPTPSYYNPFPSLFLQGGNLGALSTHGGTHARHDPGCANGHIEELVMSTPRAVPKKGVHQFLSGWKIFSKLQNFFFTLQLCFYNKQIIRFPHKLGLYIYNMQI